MILSVEDEQVYDDGLLTAMRSEIQAIREHLSGPQIDLIKSPRERIITRCTLEVYINHLRMEVMMVHSRMARRAVKISTAMVVKERRRVTHECGEPIIERLERLADGKMMYSAVCPQCGQLDYRPYKEAVK